MNCHRFIWFFVFFGQQFFTYCIRDNKNCSTGDLSACPDEELCVQISWNSSTGACSCKKDYTRAPLSGVCEPADLHYSQDFSNRVSASAIAVGLLVPAISVLVIGTLVLVGRRYRWVHRFREQAHQLTVRNYDNVLISNDEDQTAG